MFINIMAVGFPLPLPNILFGVTIFAVWLKTVFRCFFWVIDITHGRGVVSQPEHKHDIHSDT